MKPTFDELVERLELVGREADHRRQRILNLEHLLANAERDVCLWYRRARMAGWTAMALLVLLIAFAFAVGLAVKP